MQDVLSLSSPMSSDSEIKKKHISVMPTESVEFISPQAGYYYIDCTLGLGGHTELFLQACPDINIIACERDEPTLQLAKKRLEKYTDKISFHHTRFSNIPEIIQALAPEIKSKIRGVFFDLGISSLQLDNDNYGITFDKSAWELPLDMRLDEWCQNSASEILNKFSEKKLADIFFFYADYRYSRRLAREIVNTRPLYNIGDFVKLCQACGRYGKLHPATLPMMALRIFINNEFGEIESTLNKLAGILEQDTTVAVLSFHSGEDRIVKNIFKSLPEFEIITKKPLAPTPEEVRYNPRARSAKLRVAKINYEKK